jgi:hypothetical protein
VKNRGKQRIFKGIRPFQRRNSRSFGGAERVPDPPDQRRRRSIEQIQVEEEAAEERGEAEDCASPLQKLRKR